MDQVRRALESYLGRFLLGIVAVMLLVAIFLLSTERDTGWRPAHWVALSSILIAVVLGLALLVAAHHLFSLRRLRWEQARPFVLGALEPDPVDAKFLYLVIRNSGATTATNVELRIHPPPTRNQGTEPVDYPASLPSLAPGQALHSFWGVVPFRQHLEPPQAHHVLEIGYDDARRTRHTSVSALD